MSTVMSRSRVPNNEAGRQAGETREHTVDGYRLQWNTRDQRPSKRGYGKMRGWDSKEQLEAQDNKGK